MHKRPGTGQCVHLCECLARARPPLAAHFVSGECAGRAVEVDEDDEGEKPVPGASYIRGLEPLAARGGPGAGPLAALRVPGRAPPCSVQSPGQVPARPLWVALRND